MTLALDRTHPASLKQEILLHRMTHRIRRSLDLQEILDAMAAELQQFLGIDRIKIYQFHPDGTGQVVAEYLGHDRRLPSLHGLNFPADDIPDEVRRLFIEARVRTVVDVETRQIGHSRLRDPETGEILSEDWVFRPLDPCHAEYLSTMGVKSSLVAPIMHHEHLWGLLVGHHVDPQSISEEQLRGVQLLVEQLSVAIAQSHLLNQARAKAEREATIHRIATLLQSLTTIELEAGLETAITALQGSGGRLLIQPEFTQLEGFAPRLYTSGPQPILHQLSQLSLIEQYQCWQEHLIGENLQPWHTADLYNVGNFRTLQPAFQSTKIRGILIVPLVSHQKVMGCLTIFRDEFVTETLWAGQFDPDMRQIYPRQSFEVWRQSLAEQTHPWTLEQVELAQGIGAQFAAAIERHELYQQVQTLNANLEHQVQQRTVELRQALTELQQTQTQLVQSEKMSSLGQLVAGVAHEINNPVNFIHGNITHASQYTQELIDLLALYHQEYPQPTAKIQAKIQDLDLEFLLEDLAKLMSSMRIGTNRIQQIVLSLRNFSRLDQAELKSIDLHEGIESTLLILQHRLKAKPDYPGIELVKEYGNLPLVECYAGAMNQVFMNLLSNAIDALEESIGQKQLRQTSPSICIKTQVIAPDRVQIRIIDNGKGISETAHRHLFDPFFTTKPIGKGTGLGLSISYQIITQQHGGVLNCQSAMGQGTEFAIEIPIRQI